MRPHQCLQTFTREVTSKLDLILSVMLILTACSNPVKEDLRDKKGEKGLEKKNTRLDHREVPEDLLTLSSQPETNAADTDIRENLFGKFFCDRAEFYIIKEPQNEIYSSTATSITLFYLDGELGKTTYELNQDIQRDLLKAFGKFSISGRDLKNRDIVASKHILIQTEKGPALNEGLDNYELKWTFGNRQVEYRVNVNRENRKYVYTEKVKDYDKSFKEIERYCS